LAGSTAAQVQIDFSPSVVNLSLGESALVEINVTGVPAQGLAAFQFDLDFDPLAIQVLNPNEAFRGTIFPFAPLGNNPLCTTVRATPSCDDPNWLLDSTGRTPLGIDAIDNVVGHVEVAFGTSGAPAAPLGNGTIALIEVFGEFNGTAGVTLSNVILADNQQPPMVHAFALGSALMVTSGTGIANQAPILDAVGDRQLFEGQVLSIALSATDGDTDGLTLSATGLPAFCSLTDNGDGSGSLDCAPSIGEDGVYAVTLRVTDDGGPNLDDSETIDLAVDLTTCVDVDSDGFGSPGDISCPKGAPADCNDADAAVNPDATEICRSGLDEDCNGLDGATEPGCPSNTCVVIVLGAPATDPTITMGDPAACPAPGALARGTDLIWGDFADLIDNVTEIDLGTVNQITCAGLLNTEQFDNLRPTAGELDFYLVRESGQPAYGVGNGLPRVPSSGDCP
jgi:hypothetical protein